MNRIFGTIIALCLLTPNLLFAAWWNPLTWKVQVSFGTNQKQATTTQPVSLVKPGQNTKPSVATTTVVKKPVTSPAPVKLTNAQIIKKVKPAVVYIETENARGSGIIISTDGYVLTNAHVVQGVNQVNISISTGDVFLAKVTGRDEEIDLAVLKMESEKPFAKVDFGDSDKVEQGDEVFTLGFPFGIKGDVSFKEGTISRRIEKYFEISAEIHPGNSGGPLVNRSAQVIGINSAAYSSQKIENIQVGETIKLAIPVKVAKDLIPELKNGKNIITDITSKNKDSQKSCESISDEAISIDVTYNEILKLYSDISVLLSGALANQANLGGLAVFRYYYNNWVSIHDRVKAKIALIEQKTSQTYYSVSQKNLSNVMSSFQQMNHYLELYYDQHLDTLNWIANSNSYWDDYLVTKTKDMLLSDYKSQQKSEDYYNMAKSFYKSVQDDVDQLKTSNGCPQRMVRVINRSMLNAMQLNPDLLCSQLGYPKEDVAVCNLYKNYSYYYDWR